MASTSASPLQVTRSSLAQLRPRPWLVMTLLALLVEAEKAAEREHDGEASPVVTMSESERAEATAFLRRPDFLDQVASRNATKALELLPHILAQPKTTGVQLVMALATQTIALAWGKARRAEGVQSNRLQGEYFTLLKQSGGAYTGRTWGSAAAAWATAVDRWSKEGLGRALDALNGTVGGLRPRSKRARRRSTGVPSEVAAPGQAGTRIRIVASPPA